MKFGANGTNGENVSENLPKKPNTLFMKLEVKLNL